MLALLAAATVAAPLHTPAPEISAYRGEHARAMAAGNVVCKAQGRVEIADPALLYRRDGKAKVEQLNELPKANHEKAVARTVGGCASPMVVQYGVGR